MEEDDRKLMSRMLTALESIADALDEQNRIAREDIKLIQEIDLDDFEGRSH